MAKRYNVVKGEDGVYRPVEREHGHFVEHNDYAALAERCERLQLELQETVRQWDEMAALCSFWKEQAETLGYVHPEERELP